MQWYHYTLIGVIIFLITLVVISYFQAKKASSKLDAETFKQNMRKGQLIDVRTKQEFKSGHINGARNISVTTIGRDYQKLRKDLPVYIYCSTGRRSSRAAIYLTSKGFNEIYELDKGLKNWNDPLK